MQSSTSSRPISYNRKPDASSSTTGSSQKVSQAYSLAEKISNWSKRSKSSVNDVSNHPPAIIDFKKSSDVTKSANNPKVTSNPTVKSASIRSYPTSNVSNRVSSQHDKQDRPSHSYLVEGMSKVQASSNKSRLYPPKADETVVTASTGTISIQNSTSVDDRSPLFTAPSCTSMISNLPLGRQIFDGKKTNDLVDRTLPYKCHSFPAGNNTFTIDTRYNMIKMIGAGAYGVVISASDANNSTETKNVAIKMVPRAFQDEVDAKRILREIKLLQHFQHENIVSIVDMMPSSVKRNIEEFNDVYIVTDLMETDLHRIIYSKQPLSADHTQYFVYQILRGLKYIHSANVLHRDLKPSNILVNANCDLKICDFGLARGFKPTNESDDKFMELDDMPASKPQLLTEYVVTRWYRAPEIMLACRQYSKPIDVWSVGCIMAELLGRKPFLPGNDYIEQLTLITKKLGKLPEHEQDFVTSDKARRFLNKFPDIKPPTLSSQFPGVQADALDLLGKMLTIHPGKRITVIQALQHPYFSSIHNADDEPIAECPFDFSFEDEKLYRVRIQELIWQEVCRFRPKCFPIPPRKELSDRR